MSAANLIKRGSLRGFATATPATPATHSPFKPPTVATVATVAVANEPARAANEPTAAVAETIDWRELAAAYTTHHFKCQACIAAGRGSRYGLRCGAGAALWQTYTEGYL